MLVLRRLLASAPALALFVTAASLLTMAELSPATFERLMQEDGWAEWATFAAFACAAVLAVRAARRSALASLAGVTLLGLSLFCTFVAGEEISWGQRLFGFMPARVFLEHNFQQESNLHNLLKEVVETRWVVFLLCALYGVIGPYCAQLFRLPRALFAAPALLPWFALIGWLEFSYPYELVGELAELLLGLVFLLDVLDRSVMAEAPAHESPVVAQPVLALPNIRAVALVAATLALGVLLAKTNDLVLRAQSPELIEHTRRELATLSELIAKQSVIAPKLFHKREIHKRVYTAVQAGYLTLAPDDFYLDAWNSPYWIAFQRTSATEGVVHLYSFGPNRRRDAREEGASASRDSDDVRISIPVARASHAQR